MNPPLTRRRENPPPGGRDSDLEYSRPPLTERERVELRSIALPTLLAALTMHEAARALGERCLAALTDLAEADAWVERSVPRRGRMLVRARRARRLRALRALEAVHALDVAIDAARAWATRFAREMEAVRDAERAYMAAQYTSAVQW